MKISQLHPWNLAPKDAITLQRKLQGSIDISRDLDPSSCSLIAGVDASSSRFDPLLTAGVVVWERETGRIVETTAVQEPSAFPYIPGLLSFREIPILSKAIAQLRATPDIFLVDGQGIAHPRGLGIAAHLGLLIDVPTVGVAKSRLCGEHKPVGTSAGSSQPLLFEGKQIGVVYRSKAKSNPLIISPGNGISMKSSLAIAQECLRGYRLPEPTRLAHLHVNAVRTGKTDAITFIRS